jgi:hypothetical protein
VTFKVINNGEMPVDNLKLKILSKYEIINYTKDFSTIPVETEVISSKIIEANTSKLVQGAGSSILISAYVSESKPTGVDKYSAYAVYDQGSNKADFIPVIHEIEKKILVLDKSIRISLLALGIAIFGAALILTLIKFFDYLKTFTNLARRKI